jgi:hypothetical protein
MVQTRRSALLALVGTTTACAFGSAEDVSTDESDDSFDPQSTVPTAEERGIHHGMALWIPAVGAYRGHNLYNGWYKCWPGDNALMLWAYSDPRYAWARTYALPHAIRDFLVTGAVGNGRFDEGRLVHPTTGAVAPTNPACSPFSNTQVLHGIIEFTRRYPKAGGARTPKQYADFIERNIKAQHKSIMARESGRPCATSGAQPQHDYTQVSTIAFHIYNATVWGKHAGDKAIRKLADDAWPLLSKQQSGNGGFKNSLRDAQVLYLLTAAIDAGFAGAGAVAARNRLEKSFSRAANGGLLAAGERGAGSLDTQTNAYHFLASNSRPFTATTFLRNRLCYGGGYAWLGKGGQTAPGPIEDQGMGLLGAAHIARRGWGLAGATC